jgi:hypothetical protein
MKTRPWIAVGTFILVLIVNFTVGINTDMITEWLIIIPPWITFGIAWWSIYTLLWCICLLWITHYKQRDSYLEKVTKLFTLSNLLNIWWIVLTYLDMTLLSIVVIASLTAVVYTMLRIIVVEHRHFHYVQVLKAGFGLYLGRLTLATFGLSLLIGAWEFDLSLLSNVYLNVWWLVSAFIAWWFLIRSTTPWVVITPLLGLGMIWSNLLSTYPMIAFLAFGAAIALLIPTYQAYRNPYIVS